MLAHVAERISQQADDLAELLSRESGKPIRDKRERRGKLAERALAHVDVWRDALATRRAVPMLV